LRSILSTSYPNIEVIVIDDCSKDRTTDEVKRLFPNVKVISNERERLLAGSRNVGVLEARGELIFLIDDDNIVHPDTISELLKGIISDPIIGIAGPLMYYRGGQKRIWCAVVKRSYFTSKTTFVARNEVDVGQFRHPLESEDFPNAFMVKKEVFNKIGLFDEAIFPIHYDEADFCRRARKAGYRIVLIPTAKVEHDVPLPREARDKLRLFHVHTSRRAYYTGRNRVLFHRKYSKPFEYLIFATIFLPLLSLFYIKLIFSESSHRFRDRLKIVCSYLRGTFDGFQTRLRWKGDQSPNLRGSK